MSDGRRAARKILSQVPWVDDRLRDRQLRKRDDLPYPDWPGLLGADLPAWQAALTATEGADSVLVGTTMGGFLGGAAIESLLAVCLGLRGVRPHALLCDKALPACQQSEIAMYPRLDHFVKHGPNADLCNHCFDPGRRMYEDLGVPLHRLSDYLTADDRDMARRVAGTVDLDGIAEWEHDGLRVGEHALAGALRFFARASLAGESKGPPILRRYVEAAMLCALSARRLLRTHRFVAAVFNHGIYVPQGLLAEVCRAEGVPVITWNPAYRKQCFIFSHGDTYHHTLLDEPVSLWEDIPWTPDLERQITDYLQSRAVGTADWIWFHGSPQFDEQSILRETGIDPTKPVIGLLTNVMWDAQLHYPANAFPDMLTWLYQTVDYIANRPDLQLLIRVHPAEIRGSVPSRQPLVQELRIRYPTLPENVFVVGPESDLSTYALMDMCNAVLIYGTKTGVELTSRAVPVIVAGEAWIRNKGVTFDPESAEEYFTILDRLPFPDRMSTEQTQRARRYAYHFFFRRMIPVTQAVPCDGYPPYRIEVATIDDLRPGEDKGLDVVCDGILTGSEFIFPAESTSPYAVASLHRKPMPNAESS